MLDLNRTKGSALLSCGLMLSPPTLDPSPEPTEHALRILELEPESEPKPESIEFAVEPPPPTLEPAPALPSPRIVDGKRPAPGTGLLALGSVGLVASAGLIAGAMVGPGWLDLDRRDAAIAGGLAIPLALGGVLMVVGGSKSARRFQNWSSHNHFSPPDSGNGILVIGAVTTLGFAGATAGATQWALNKPVQQRGDWAPTVVAGSATVIAMLLLTAGMLRRSKFASWEQHAYALPGAMALEHGGGVSVAGRF
jgi:hypothetical protein